MAQGTRPVIDRLLAKIVIDANGCWIFTGVLLDGYGQIHVGSRTDGTRRMAAAHRVSYEHFVGPIPDDLQLDHVKARGCLSRACCCPWHLEAVTQTENVRRGTSFAAVNAAKTHCHKGHLYDEANTRMYRGGRFCRLCDRDRSRERQGYAGSDPTNQTGEPNG